MRGARALFVMTVLSATVATGWSVLAHDAIPLRRKIMKAVGSAAKEASEMASGQRAFDPSKAAAGMSLIARSWPEVVRLFPPGSDRGGKTRAEAEIWSSFSAFEAHGQHMVEAADHAGEAAGRGIEAFRGAFEPVAQSCKRCHAIYMSRD